MRHHGEDVGSGSQYWTSSVAAGVDFAKRNNLLGVFFDPKLLVRYHICSARTFFLLMM